MDSDFVFFLAFDVGGSHYEQKRDQHTFKFIDNNTLMANVFGHLEIIKNVCNERSSQMSS